MRRPNQSTCLALFLAAILVTARCAAFDWPQGRRAAVSFTFDDARPSQLDGAVTELARRNVRATFYVLPDPIEKSLQGWTEVVAKGHEIGNHTTTHPCTGNFPWSRQKGVEDFTLDRMESDIAEANRRIEEQLGVRPTSFAYPCGEMTVGRGADARSIVPLIADTFGSGRGDSGGPPNAPDYVDLSQLRGITLDGMGAEEALALLDRTETSGGWLIFVSHDVGEPGPEATDVAVLRKLIDRATDPSRGFWVAPVGTVARHVAAQRAAAVRPR